MAPTPQASKDDVARSLSVHAKQRLRKAAWDFLVEEAESVDQAVYLGSKHVKGYATDFVDGSAHDYWPLSGRGNWAFEFSLKDAAAYVADELLVIQNIHKRSPNMAAVHLQTPQKDESTVSGLLPTPPDSKSKKRPKNKINIDSTTTEPSASGPSKAGGLSSPTLSPTSPSKVFEQADPFGFARRTNGTNREASPLRNSKHHPQPHSVEATMSRPGSAGDQVPPNSRDDDVSVIVVDRASSKAAKKRAFPSDGGEAQESALVTVKRRHVQDASAATADEVGAGAAQEMTAITTEAAAKSLAAPAAPAPTTPSAASFRSSVRPSSALPQADLPGELITIPRLGLRYSQTELAQVPSTVLNYLIECRNHSLRKAEIAGNELDREKCRERSLWCQGVLNDIESRMRAISQDTPEAQQVVTNFSMW